MGDGGAKLTAIFGMIGVVVLAAGSACPPLACRLPGGANTAGESRGRATFRALSGEDDHADPDSPTG